MYLICGEALYDFFNRADTAGDGNGDARRIHFEATAGGSPFNLAVGIRRLGAPVALCAGISNDQLGVRLLAFLEHEKVNSRFIIRSAQPTPISLAQTDENGLPHYAFYGTGAADTGLRRADLPKDLSAISGIHFGSYATVVPPIADTLAQLAADAVDKFLAYDPNVRLAIQPDRAVWRARFNAYAQTADYIKLSADDFNMLFAGESPDAMAEKWLAHARLQLVILTDEWRAIRAWHKNGWRLKVTPAAPEKMADSVGAGDSFQAAMLFQLDARDKRRQLAEMDEAALREKINFASRCAAHTCARRGANMPRRGEVAAAESGP